MAEVGPVEGVDALLGHVEDRRDEHAAGVVDQDVDPAVALEGGGHGPVDLVGLADVGDDGQPADRVGGRRAGVGIALPDRHVGPEGGQPGGDAPPQAGAATGDGRDLAREGDGVGVQHHGPQPPWPARARRAFFSTLPAAFTGSSPTTSMARGTL